MPIDVSALLKAIAADVLGALCLLIIGVSGIVIPWGIGWLLMSDEEIPEHLMGPFQMGRWVVGALLVALLVVLVEGGHYIAHDIFAWWR